MKLERIQALRGIAALLVVLFHTSEVSTKALGGSALGFLDYRGMYGVDIFFVISGFVITYFNWDRLGSRQGGISFMMRRIGRIYPTYWVVYALTAAVFLLLAPDMHVPITSAGWAMDALLLPSWQDTLVDVSWTLVFELYFYAVFSLGFLLPRARFLDLLFLWTVWLVAVNAAYPDISSTVGETRHNIVQLLCSPLSLEFIVGCVAAILLRQNIHLPRPLFRKAALWYVVMIAASTAGKDDGLYRVLTMLVPGAFIVYSFALEDLRALPTHRVWRFFVYLGDMSYSLYLSHLLAIQAFVRIGPRLHLPAYLTEAGMVISALGFGTLLYLLVERPSQGVIRRISSPRSSYARESPKPKQPPHSQSVSHYAIAGGTARIPNQG